MDANDAKLCDDDGNDDWRQAFNTQPPLAAAIKMMLNGADNVAPVTTANKALLLLQITDDNLRRSILLLWITTHEFLWGKMDLGHGCRDSGSRFTFDGSLGHKLVADLSS